MEDKTNLDVLVDENNQFSPYSLQKVIDNVISPEQPLVVLLENEGRGFAHDAAETMYVTPEECKTQALYYKSLYDSNPGAPWYLIKYLVYWFDLTPEIFNTPEEYNAFMSLPENYNKLGITNDQGILIDVNDSKHLENWFHDVMKYVEYNREMLQCIGLVQLIAGSLNAAKKTNSGIRLFIQEPETHLHPKREVRVMMVLNHIRDSYGK